MVNDIAGNRIGHKPVISNDTVCYPMKVTWVCHRSISFGRKPFHRHDVHSNTTFILYDIWLNMKCCRNFVQLLRNASKSLEWLSSLFTLPIYFYSRISISFPILGILIFLQSPFLMPLLLLKIRYIHFEFYIYTIVRQETEI